MYRLLERAQLQLSISRADMIFSVFPTSVFPTGTSVIAAKWGKILMASTMVFLGVELVIGI